MNLLTLSKLAEKASKENLKFVTKLRKKNPVNLDKVVHDIHDDVFTNTNCLDCANCCKTISPMITNKDIEKISKYLRLKPSVFTERYIHIDNDDQYVFNQTPCPFLMPDNYCQIYEQRPKACAEYPHTDRKKFYQLLQLTLKNTFICPAAYEIMEKLKLMANERGKLKL